MKKNRIKPLPLPLSEDIQSSMNKIFPTNLPSPNLYRLVARNKALWMDLVDAKIIGRTGLFNKKRLPPELREKIILRTCVAAKNDYEYALHIETISLQMGLTKSQIADVRNVKLNPNYWSAADLVLFQLIDGLVHKIEVTQATFDQLKQHFSEENLLDITFIVGLYTGVAMTVALGQPAFDNYREFGNKPQR